MSKPIEKLEIKEDNQEVPLTEKDDPKTLEDILTYIKPFGLWQMLIILMTIYNRILMAMTTLIVTFYQITPDFACKLPLEDESYANWTVEMLRNFSNDNCHVFNISYNGFILNNYSQSLSYVKEVTANQTQLIKCQSWKYDRSDMHETAVTQWDLICEKKWMIEHGLMLNFFGFLVGSLISGFISDSIAIMLVANTDFTFRIGRKKAFLGSLALTGISGIILSFVQNYYTFIIIRFIFAIGKIGASLTNYCYTLETTTGKTRTWVGGLIFVPSSCGYSLLAGVAYLVRDWRYLNLCVSAPCLLLVLLWCVIPESPRWLLVVGRIKEARQVLETAAWLNGSKMPDVDLNEISSNLNREDGEKRSKRENFFRIFKYKTLVLRMFAIWFIWIVITLVYYGLAFNIITFSGNVFINTALAGAPVEIPGAILCATLMHVGRRPALYLTLFFTGISLVITPWMSEDVKIVLGFAGKLGITASFSVIYTFTNELYPTVIRNTGLSTSSAVARVGPMIAPYISSLTKLNKNYEPLPLVIFGVVALAGGLVTFSLPETLGSKMPEYFEDAIRIRLHKEAANPPNNETE